MPISKSDFGYLCVYHKQHSAVDLYGFTSAEIDLLDNLAKYLCSREIEWKDVIEKVVAKMALGAIERFIRKQSHQTKENMDKNVINPNTEDMEDDEHKVDYGDDNDLGVGEDYEVEDDVESETLSLFYKQRTMC